MSTPQPGFNPYTSGNNHSRLVKIVISISVAIACVCLAVIYRNNQLAHCEARATDDSQTRISYTITPPFVNCIVTTELQSA